MGRAGHCGWKGGDGWSRRPCFLLLGRVRVDSSESQMVRTSGLRVAHKVSTSGLRTLVPPSYFGDSSEGFLFMDVDDQRSSPFSNVGTLRLPSPFVQQGRAQHGLRTVGFQTFPNQLGHASDSPCRNPSVLDTEEQGSEGFRQKCYGADYHCLVVSLSVPSLTKVSFLSCRGFFIHRLPIARVASRQQPPMCHALHEF